MGASVMDSGVIDAEFTNLPSHLGVWFVKLVWSVSRFVCRQESCFNSSSDGPYTTASVVLDATY